MKLRHGPGNGSHFSAVKPASFTFSARSRFSSIDRGAGRPAIGVNFHPFARRPAEQIVQRLAGGFGDDVPHGDFDRAPGRQQIQRRAPHREIVEDHLRAVADRVRAPADHVFRHDLQQMLDHLFLAGRDIGLAPAMHAGLGFHAAEQQILRQAGVEQERLDARDFHGFVLPACRARLYARRRSREASANGGRHNVRGDPARSSAAGRINLAGGGATAAMTPSEPRSAATKLAGSGTWRQSQHVRHRRVRSVQLRVVVVKADIERVTCIARPSPFHGSNRSAFVRPPPIMEICMRCRHPDKARVAVECQQSRRWTDAAGPVSVDRSLQFDLPTSRLSSRTVRPRISVIHRRRSVSAVPTGESDRYRDVRREDRVGDDRPAVRRACRILPEP